MNQQYPQQNYQQQYAPQYPGQYPPQYNQQMQQYPQQQYQVAPPGSQYATHAPSGYPMAPPQPAMMPGFGRGPDGLYRGQRPPNPCSCCKWCCDGTCSLRIGCYIIGALLVLGSISIGGSGEGTNSMMPGDKSTSRGLIYSDAFFFNLVPGVLLLVGAGCLDRTCCIVAAIFLVLGGVFSFIAYIFLAYVLLTVLPEDPKVTAAATTLVVAAIIGLAIRSYYACCACALAKQIQNGEYNVQQPQPMMVVQQTVTTAPSAAYNAQPVQISNNQEEQKTA